MDHVFSHSDLVFFSDFIRKTFKLHPNIERCVRLEVARLLVVVNLEKSLPESISVHGSGVVIPISYPSLPQCYGRQQQGHTYKTYSKNKQIKNVGTDAMKKTSETEDAIASENSKSINIEKPVLEVAKHNT